MEKPHRILMPVLGASALLGMMFSQPTTAVASNDQPVQVRASLDKPLLVTGGGAQKVIIKIEVEGGNAPESTRQPLNLAVVLDRSGSMTGAKMEQAKQAASLLVDQLDQDDIFSLVVYDGEVDVLVPSAKIGNRQSRIRNTIQSIRPGGSTALYDGVVEGGRQLQEFFHKQKINRVILLSDGIANVGPSSNREITTLGSSLIAKGISVTTIGLGDSYNEDLMTTLAEASDANYYYVADVETLSDVFAKELGELKTIVARDIEIEIVCPEGVKPIRFLGRRDELKSRSASVNFATLSGEQVRELFLECEVGGDALDKITEIGNIGVRYQDSAGGGREAAPSPVLVAYTRDRDLAEKSSDAAIVAEAVLYDNARETEIAIAAADRGDQAGAKAQIARQTSRLRSILPSAPAAQQAAIEKQIEGLEKAESDLTGSGFAPSARKSMARDAYELRNAKK